MQKIIPLSDNIKVLSYTQENNFSRIVVIFLHGFGDTLMFRPVFEELQHQLSEVTIDLYVHQIDWRWRKSLSTALK